eukprot:3024551-Pyramimonas_sp.AAC.1
MGRGRGEGVARAGRGGRVRAGPAGWSLVRTAPGEARVGQPVRFRKRSHIDHGGQTCRARSVQARH